MQIKNINYLVFIACLMAAHVVALTGVDEVKSAIKEKNPKRVYLIIGASPGEERFAERFNHLLKDEDNFVIFGDIARPTTSMPGHVLVGDFNSLDELVVIAKEFPLMLDVIITDGAGTTKYLTRYSNDHVRTLSKALKPGGQLFFHDDVVVRFGMSQVANNILLSEQDFADFHNWLANDFADGFKKLSSFSLPLNVVANVPIDNKELSRITDEVMKVIDEYAPADFIKVANKLVEMGLKDAALMKGRNFVVTEKEKVRQHIALALRKNNFIENQLPQMITRIKTAKTVAMTSSLSGIFSQIAVASQDNDRESLDILVPKDRGSESYIVYKLKKASSK